MATARTEGCTRLGVDLDAELLNTLRNRLAVSRQSLRAGLELAIAEWLGVPAPTPAKRPGPRSAAPADPPPKRPRGRPRKS